MQLKYILNVLFILLIFGCQAEQVRESSEEKSPEKEKEVKQAPERMEIADDLPYFIKKALLDLRNGTGSSQEEPETDVKRPQAEDKVEQPRQPVKPDIKQEEPAPEQVEEELPPEEESEEEVIEIYLEDDSEYRPVIIR